MNIGGRQYYIYGDPAYILRQWIKGGYPRIFSTVEQLLNKKLMNGCREAVKWSYKDMKEMWTSKYFRRMLKVQQTPIYLMYKGAELLCNI